MQKKKMSGFLVSSKGPEHVKITRRTKPNLGVVKVRLHRGKVAQVRIRPGESVPTALRRAAMKTSGKNPSTKVGRQYVILGGKEVEVSSFAEGAKLVRDFRKKK